VKLAKDQIESGNGLEYIPAHWEEVKMSYQTFYSWYQEDDLSCMFDFYREDYDFPILNKITIPVHTVVGDKDEFFYRTNPENPQEAMQILLKNLKKGSGKLIPGATHNLRGYEDVLVEEISGFIP
jgi:pimeloyl-ACP methyl ester carboxylesterase